MTYDTSSIPIPLRYQRRPQMKSISRNLHRSMVRRSRRGRRTISGQHPRTATSRPECLHQHPLRRHHLGTGLDKSLGGATMSHFQKWSLLCVLAAFFFLVGPCRAATVSGSITCVAANGTFFAATNGAVTVFRPDIGRSNVAGVGQDSSFYLYNIPSGQYVLEIWSRANLSLPVRTFQIIVAEPVTQIPRISLPC